MKQHNVHSGFLTAAVLLAFLLPPFFGPAGAQSGDPGLRGAVSLKEALRKTYTDNPAIMSARSALLAAQEKYPQAMAGWKPTIEAGASVMSSSVDSDPDSTADGSTASEVEVSFTQPLYRGGQTVAGVDAARYLISSQQALLEATEQDILLQAAVSYMEVVRSESVLGLQQGNRELLNRQLEATRERFEVGELTRTDVAQAQARLANAESSVISAQGELKSALAGFERLTGIAKIQAVFPEMDVAIPDSLERALEIAESSSPSIKAAEYSREASRKGVRSVTGELLPQVSLSGSWNRTKDPSPGLLDETTTGLVGITATIPLYQAGAVRSRVREARYLAAQSMTDIADVRRSVREEVITSWENLLTARAGIKSREAQVEATALAKEGVHEEESVGTRTVLDVLDADQEHLDSRVALVTARTNEVVATFRLAASIGLLTPQNLGFPEEVIDYDGRLESLKWKVFGTEAEYPLGQK